MAKDFPQEQTKANHVLDTADAHGPLVLFFPSGKACQATISQPVFPGGVMIQRALRAAGHWLGGSLATAPGLGRWSLLEALVQEHWARCSWPSMRSCAAQLPSRKSRPISPIIPRADHVIL